MQGIIVEMRATRSAQPPETFVVLQLREAKPFCAAAVTRAPVALIFVGADFVAINMSGGGLR